jgi:hypothetical protein
VSVLNQASDGLYTVLIVLVRALVRLGPIAREDLLTACGAGLQGVVEPSHLSRTLTRWTELGLFGLQDNLVVLAPPYDKALGNTADEAETILPGVARTIVLAADNNARFWEAEASKSADLCRGLSWLLAQDVYTIDTNAPRTIANLEIEQLSDESHRIFQNETRWNGLRAWMPYLGFAREGAQMAVDPTAAVRDVLPAIFASGVNMNARQFVEELARLLPVLDGGTYRSQIEAVLDPSQWRKPPDGQLSTALSRALQRLEFEGQIALGRGADAKDGVSLTGTGGRVWREVTDVHRREQKGTKQ